MRDRAQWDARTPILFVVGMSVLVLLVDRPGTLACMALASILWAAASGLSTRQWLGLVGVNLAATWSLVLAQAIFYEGVPRVVWFTLVPAFDAAGLDFAGIYAYRAGVTHGLIQAMRFCALLTAGITCASTISPGGLLSALARLRVPYVLCFLTATGLRFVPVVIEEWQIVRRARRLRTGARPTRWRHAARWEMAALRPVLGRALRRSTSLATALTARKFDPTRPRTSATPSRWGRYDTAVTFGMGVAVLVSLTGRIALFLAEWGLWRPSELAPLLAALRTVLS